MHMLRHLAVCRSVSFQWAYIPSGDTGGVKYDTGAPKLNIRYFE